MLKVELNIVKNNYLKGGIEFAITNLFFSARVEYQGAVFLGKLIHAGAYYRIITGRYWWKGEANWIFQS